MLSFAYWAGLGGVICSLGLALAAWVGAPFTGYPAPYIVLFISVFVTFAPAVMAHPARTRSGGRFNVELRALANAEPWTIALSFALLVSLYASALGFSPHGDHFAIDRAALLGRTDRQLMLSFFFGAFHAIAVCVASSGLRWGLYPSPPRLAWFTRLLSSPLAIDAAEELPGAPFSYRTTTMSWFLIALEGSGAIAAIVVSGRELRAALPFLHANFLALALLAVPSWHILLKVCGQISFRVEAGCLLTRHFPFTFRNRRIPVGDVRGIQVHAELDSRGIVTHYSLLLISDHSSTERLVERLPSAEHASVLAQRIDSLIRLGTAGTLR
jgi:hypothetical protein